MPEVEQGRKLLPEGNPQQHNLTTPRISPARIHYLRCTISRAALQAASHSSEAKKSHIAPPNSSLQLQPIPPSQALFWGPVRAKWLTSICYCVTGPNPKRPGSFYNSAPPNNNKSSSLKQNVVSKLIILKTQT